MKILAIADLHANFEALEKIKKAVKREKPDLIVDAGDLSIFGSGLQESLEELNSLDVPILLIHGNHEIEEEMKLAEKTYKNIKQIHAKHKIVDDVLFLGYGGGGFLVEDRRFEKLAKKFEQVIKKNKGKKVIVVAHGPPYGTETDYKKGFGHTGNKSLRRFIEKAKPALVITGHIEDCRKKTDKIGRTKVVNPTYKGKIIKI